MKLWRGIFLLTIIFVFAAICFSQSTTKENEKKRREERSKKYDKPIEVKANVMVLDSTGKLVDDVKVEDFRIFEDDKEQKVIYFAKKDPVLNIALAVDNSGSMREVLDKVITAGSNIISNLRPADEAFIVRFVRSDNVEIFQDWTANKGQLQSGLDNMFIEGGQTAIIDAVYLTASKILEREKQDKSKRYAVVLISDGVDADSFYNLSQLMGLLKNTDIQIFQLSFPEREALKRAKNNRYSSVPALSLNNFLALETGGAAYNLSENQTREEINNAIKNMMVELQSNYIIGYVPANQKRDGSSRKLRIEIADDAKGGKRQAFVRQSFIVPKN